MTRHAQLESRFSELVAQGSAAMASEHGYARSDPVTGVQMSEEDEQLLHRLLLERVYAKRLRNFAAADALREQLRQAGVHIDEGARSFEIRPRLRQAHGYTRTDDGSVPVTARDQEQLDAALLERVNARITREFDRADELLKELRQQGVTIDDGALTYSVLGPQATTAPSERRGGQRGSSLPLTDHGLTRDDGGAVQLSEADQQMLDTHLLERERARRCRDYAAADKIRDMLKEAGVHIDHVKRTYRVVPRWRARHATVADAKPDGKSSPPSIFAPDPEPAPYARDAADDSGVAMSEADKGILVKRLADRRAAQRRRDYPAADAIREQLKGIAQKCGCRIVIDDRECTFRFVVQRPRESGGGSAGRGARAAKGQAQQHTYARTPDPDASVEGWSEGGGGQIGDGGDSNRADGGDGAAEGGDKGGAEGGGGGEAGRKRAVRFVPFTDEKQRVVDSALLERENSRAVRNYELADRLRDLLGALGVFVDDLARTYYYRASRDRGTIDGRVEVGRKRQRGRIRSGAGVGEFGRGSASTSPGRVGAEEGEHSSGASAGAGASAASDNGDGVGGGDGDGDDNDMSPAKRQRGTASDPPAASEEGSVREVQTVDLDAQNHAMQALAHDLGAN
eukprot:g4480.t1